jgi:hypothetical protein
MSRRSNGELEAEIPMQRYQQAAMTQRLVPIGVTQNDFGVLAENASVSVLCGGDGLCAHRNSGAHPHPLPRPRQPVFSCS